MGSKQVSSLPVFRTEDYKIFSKLSGNRDLDQHHVRRLAKAIEKDPEFTLRNPILVNEAMQVIDGQHRLAAFETFYDREGVAHPVYYIIRDGLKLSDARLLNAGAKPWNPRDYAQAYSLEGNRHYSTYLRFARKYTELPHRVVARTLGSSDAAMKEFKYGTFTVVDEKGAEKILRQLTEAGAAMGIGVDQSFHLALGTLITHPDYDHGRMIEQIEKHKGQLRSVPARRAEMRVAFNTIYNLGQKDKKDLLIR